MSVDILDRLEEHCIGHPHAKIEWPHRLLHDAVAEIKRLRDREENRPRPFDEYHEDMGPVLWWSFYRTADTFDSAGEPIWSEWKLRGEPPYVGTPNDLGREVLIMTTAHTVAHGEHEPYQGANQQHINVGGWPGYHTHFTPIPIPKEPT